MWCGVVGSMCCVVWFGLVWFGLVWFGVLRLAGGSGGCACCPAIPREEVHRPQLPPDLHAQRAELHDPEAHPRGGSVAPRFVRGARLRFGHPKNNLKVSPEI